MSNSKCKFCPSIDREFYYESDESCKISNYVSTYSGFCDCNLDCVLVSKDAGSSQSENIKQGQKLGSMFSVVCSSEIDDNLEVLNVNTVSEDEPWTLNRIKREVKFSSDLTEIQTDSVHKMLSARSGVMSVNNDDIGHAAVTSHKIKLYDDTPIRIKPRHFPAPVAKQIEDECQRLLNLDVIEHSKSPFSSPVCPVFKPGKTMRLCIDYRKLNEVTVADRFPIPSLQDYIFGLYNRKFFTSLDLTSGFFQVPLEESSRPYTAFSTQHNHYQFKRLSFGLKNCPSAFQREIQAVLQDFGANILVYIDDILILSDSFEEHLDLVDRVMCTLDNHGIKIKMPKCRFFQDNIEFLGHQISRSGVRKSSKFIEQVREFPRPTNVTELRGFLGTVNFQRKFLPHCSTLARPLSRLTGGSGKDKIIWNEELESSFVVLKEALIRDVELSYPDYSPDASKLELHVDASNLGAGATLSQIQNGVYVTIFHSSMSFSKTQCRYSTIEKELASLRWAVKNLKCFLYKNGNRFGVDFH